MARKIRTAAIIIIAAVLGWLALGAATAGTLTPDAYVDQAVKTARYCTTVEGQAPLCEYGVTVTIAQDDDRADELINAALSGHLPLTVVTVP